MEMEAVELDWAEMLVTCETQITTRHRHLSHSLDVFCCSRRFTVDSTVLKGSLNNDEVSTETR